MSQSDIHHTDLLHYHREPGGFPPFPPLLGRIRLMAPFIGGISLLLCVMGWYFDPAHFYRSWLFAYLFWLGITMGCLGMVMVSEMTGGEWGVIMRRFGETAFMNLPVMAVLFIPLMFSYKYIFPWGHAEDFDGKLKAALDHRAAWFNPTAFTIRQVVYYIIWCTLAFIMSSVSQHLDENENPGLRRKLRMV